MLVVGGWFDAEDLSGPFRVNRAIRDGNRDTPTSLVIGPWTHGGWAVGDGRRLGAVDFATDTAAFYRQHVIVPFFEHHLKDGPDPALPELDRRTDPGQGVSHLVCDPRQQLSQRPGDELLVVAQSATEDEVRAAFQ